MGLLSNLFSGGAGGDERMAASLASIIVMSDALLNIKDKLFNPANICRKVREVLDV